MVQPCGSPIIEVVRAIGGELAAPMRVLMSTWGWRSHFYSLVPLAWALQAAGHEVRVASHPSMTATITAAGLAAVPLGADLDFAEVFAGTIGEVGRLDEPRRGPDRGTLEPEISADGGVVRFADAILDQLIDFGRTYRADLMVWEPFNLAAPVAAAALGVPGVLQLWGPDSSVTLRLDKRSVLGALAGRHDLDPDDVSLTGDLTLDPVPPPMQVPLTGPVQAVRYVPYNGTAQVPGWLHGPARRPRVCVTAGTMMGGAGLLDRLDLPTVVRAVAELDVEVVVALERGRLVELGPLPDNVIHAEAPLALRLLLPTCAAIVQQGGAGTTMTALSYGVPQLILPQVSDQHFNGERLVATGAGTWLAADSGTAVRDTVGRLLSEPAWAEQAAVMRDRIRATPPPAAAVPGLETLAAHRPSDVPALW